MSSFLEKEILGKFVEAVKKDATIPAELANSISILHEQDKLSKGTNLKKALEEFTPSEQDASNESKKD